MKQPKKQKTDHRQQSIQDQFQDVSQYAAQNEEVEIVHTRPDVHEKTRFSSALQTPGGKLSFQVDLPDRHDFGLQTHLDHKAKTTEKGAEERIVEQDETVDFQTDGSQTGLHTASNLEKAAGTLIATQSVQEKVKAESVSQNGKTTTIDQKTIQTQVPPAQSSPKEQQALNIKTAVPKPEKLDQQPTVLPSNASSSQPAHSDPNRNGKRTPKQADEQPSQAQLKGKGAAAISTASNPEQDQAERGMDACQKTDSIGTKPESIQETSAEPASTFQASSAKVWSQEEQAELEAAGLDLEEWNVEAIEAVELEEAAAEPLKPEDFDSSNSVFPKPKTAKKDQTHTASVSKQPPEQPKPAADQTENPIRLPKLLENAPLHSNATPKQAASSNREASGLDDGVPKPISPHKRFIQIVKTVSKYKALREMTPVKLRMILEDLGPTYVKLGQIMSSRSDLLPSQYTKELEKLRSNVAPMPYETVRKEIIKAYGKTPEELFTSFSKEPLGSASMAQVHEAITHDGQKVVVKVQRPGIYGQMKVDVEMLRKAGKILSLSEVVRDLVDVEDVIDEFWTSAQEEMDFRHEAANAIRFAKECEELQYIHVPKIYTDYTKPNILVMEEIGGDQIDEYPKLAKLGYDRREIATRLGMNFLSQVIDYGFFHADPHSGNLKIEDGKICWLDFGMMGEISQSESAAIFQALQALAARDTSRLTDAVLAIGIAPDDLDYVGFSNALDRYLSRYVGQDFASLDLGKMIEEAIEVCNTYKIRLPKGITMLARSMVTIQGTLKDLDPSVNMAFYISESKTSIDQIDWNQELQKLLRQGYADGQALMNLPLKLDHILGLLQRGQLRLGLSLAELQSDLLPEVNRWVDRLIVCILIAALLMGSSIICTTNMKPRFLEIPLLGFAGFFLSFCLSLWLFYKMIFHAKKGNKLF